MRAERPRSVGALRSESRPCCVLKSHRSQRCEAPQKLPAQRSDAIVRIVRTAVERGAKGSKAARETPLFFASVLPVQASDLRGALEAVKPARKEIPYYAEEASPRETCFRRDRGPESTPLRHAGWRPWSDRARVRDRVVDCTSLEPKKGRGVRAFPP